ncbi:MAG: 3'(2'),5'-bisphosphate nucleotidase CysQ [Candidatus Dormibacteria bacterium]
MALRRRASASGIAPGQLRDEGDGLAHRLITAALGEAYPQDPVLSEEGVDDPIRLRSRRVWIVDPLDGTREFGDPRSGDWAVHVALVVDGIPVAAAVSLPPRGLVLSTEPSVPQPRAADQSPRMVVSRTRAPAIATSVAERLGAELVPMGSAGAKSMAVVLGEADIYLHAGGQYEWDSAAPVAVALAGGLHASRIDGSPLRYNRPDPWMPDQLICRPELAESILRLVGSRTS